MTNRVLKFILYAISFRVMPFLRRGCMVSALPNANIFNEFS